MSVIRVIYFALAVATAAALWRAFRIISKIK